MKNNRDSIRHLRRLESFLLQRIIRQLPPSCVIIFLYLKRGREGRCLQRLMVRRPSGLMDGLSTLRWMCPIGLPGFELVGLPDTSLKESKERVTVHLA